MLGMPAGVRDPRQYLSDLGLDLDQTEWILEFISQHGCVFADWGIDMDTAITVRVGGRQGCKFGATIFNSAYSIALFAIRDELMKANIALRLHSSKEDFWAQIGENERCGQPETAIINATFVDDECVMVAAVSACLLDKAIDAMLSILTRIYRLQRLEIN